MTEQLVGAQEGGDRPSKERLKEAEAALDAQAYALYQKLSRDGDQDTLVVHDKWLASLDAAIQGEMDRISQQLTHRV